MIVLMIFSTFLYGVALILVEIDKDNLTSSYRLAWLSISAAITTTIVVIGIRLSLELLSSAPRALCGGASCPKAKAS